MKIKLRNIIRLVILLSTVVVIVLVLKKPAPVAQPQTPAAIAANAQSFGQKMEQLEMAAQQAPPPSRGTYQAASQNQAGNASNVLSSGLQSKVEVSINSAEVEAALSQAVSEPSGSLSPDSNAGTGSPTIKEQHVSFEGDVVRGQFLAVVAGKDVWVTVSGHLASKDGYATFDPTEFKVGDLSVPVSLVNPTLQKRLAEQHDRLKLPDYVGDVKVQGGELVMQRR
jgi:hypothetical protein